MLPKGWLLLLLSLLLMLMATGWWSMWWSMLWLESSPEYLGMGKMAGVGLWLSPDFRSAEIIN